MKNTEITELFTQNEIVQILADVHEINEHLDACIAHVMKTGTPVPMRVNLGFWEEMRLDQAAMIRSAR